MKDKQNKNLEITPVCWNQTKEHMVNSFKIVCFLTIIIDSLHPKINLVVLGLKKIKPKDRKL
jgi:hypothetical protein